MLVVLVPSSAVDEQGEIAAACSTYSIIWIAGVIGYDKESLFYDDCNVYRFIHSI